MHASDSPILQALEHAGFDGVNQSVREKPLRQGYQRNQWPEKKEKQENAQRREDYRH